MNYIRKTFVPSPPGQEIHAMATIDKKTYSNLSHLIKKQNYETPS